MVVYQIGQQTLRIILIDKMAEQVMQNDWKNPGMERGVVVWNGNVYFVMTPTIHIQYASKIPINIFNGVPFQRKWKRKMNRA